MSNLRIRESRLDLEWAEPGALTVRINGKTVVTSDDGKARLAWGLF